MTYKNTCLQWDKIVEHMSFIRGNKGPAMGRARACAHASPAEQGVPAMYQQSYDDDDLTQAPIDNLYYRQLATHRYLVLSQA